MGRRPCGPWARAILTSCFSTSSCPRSRASRSCGASRPTPPPRPYPSSCCNLGQERDVQRAMEGGAVAYRIKANLSLDDLVKQVKQVLGLEAAPVPAAAEEP